MAKTEDVRKLNKQKILDIFLKQGICTKNMLQKATNLSLGTCTNLISQLLAEKQIIRIEDGDSTGGRKAKRYALVADTILSAVAFLSHQETKDEVKCQVLNLRQQVVYESLNTYSKLSEQDITKLLAELKLKHPNIQVLALSIPGEILNGKILSCDIEALKNTALQEILTKQLKTTVLVEDELSAAALGYAKSLAVMPNILALVYQPGDKMTACRLLIDGRVVRGASHFAGSLGYLPISSQEDQQKSMKSKKGATLLLAKQTASVIAVVNPDIIAVVSKKSVSLEKLKLKINKWIDEAHIHDLVMLEGMEAWVLPGLADICLEHLRFSSEIE